MGPFIPARMPGAGAFMRPYFFRHGMGRKQAQLRHTLHERGRVPNEKSGARTNQHQRTFLRSKNPPPAPQHQTPQPSPSDDAPLERAVELLARPHDQRPALRHRRGLPRLSRASDPVAQGRPLHPRQGRRSLPALPPLGLGVGHHPAGASGSLSVLCWFWGCPFTPIASPSPLRGRLPRWREGGRDGMNAGRSHAHLRCKYSSQKRG